MEVTGYNSHNSPKGEMQEKIDKRFYTTLKLDKIFKQKATTTKKFPGEKKIKKYRYKNKLKVKSFNKTGSGFHKTFNKTGSGFHLT